MHLMLFGASYYHEYMPYERLAADIELAAASEVALGAWDSRVLLDGAK